MANNWLSNFFNFGKKDTVIVSQTEFFNNGRTVYEKYNTEQALKKGYIDNSDVYSIIRKIAKVAATINFDFYDKNGNVIENHEAHNLLRYPNPNNDAKDYRELMYTFLLATGNFYSWQPLGVANKPTYFWPLPTQSVAPIIDTNLFPHFILGYEFNMIQVSHIAKSEMMHVKLCNPTINTNGDELIGLSPLQAAAKVLQRSTDETDYSVNAFANGGVQGIVVNKSITNVTKETVETLGRLKQDWYNDTTGTKNANKIRFQPGDITYVPIGLSPVEMNVINSEIRTFKRLCNVFGVSDLLFNNTDAKYDNLENVEKQLYTNAVLPLCESAASAMCKFLKQYWPEIVDIKPNISDISVLQSDYKRVAEIFAQSPVFRPNDVLEALGYSRVESPEYDKLYIKNGYVPLDSLDLEPPAL